MSVFEYAFFLPFPLNIPGVSKTSTKKTCLVVVVVMVLFFLDLKIRKKDIFLGRKMENFILSLSFEIVTFL